MKSPWRLNNILVVANEDGYAKYYPFVAGTNHEDETFWIAGYRFIVNSDNSVLLGEKFMKDYGYVRPDGKRALILKAYGRYFPMRYEGEVYEQDNKWLEKYTTVDPVKGGRYVQGARILYGKSFEKSYWKISGSNVTINQITSVDLRTVEPLHKVVHEPGGLIWVNDIFGHLDLYHPRFLNSCPTEE